jgi:hypothetical protein
LGRGMGSSQPGKGGSWAKAWLSFFFLWVSHLPCLNSPSETIFQNILFWGFEGEGGLFLVSASSWQGAADPTYKQKLSLLFFSLGIHLDTRYLNYCPLQLRFLMEIWIAHGYLVNL